MESPHDQLRRNKKFRRALTYSRTFLEEPVPSERTKCGIDLVRDFLISSTPLLIASSEHGKVDVGEQVLGVARNRGVKQVVESKSVVR